MKNMTLWSGYRCSPVWVATILYCLSPWVGAPVLALPRPPLSVSQPTDLSQMQLLYVSASSGNDQNDGSRQAPLRTITYALSVASPNTAILLAPGTYSVATGETFPLQLKPEVLLQGNPNSQGKEVIIEGGGKFTSPTNGSQDIAILSAEGAILTGVTVTNRNYRGYGLWVESHGMTVTNNTFTGNTHDGISVVGIGTPLIEGNSFINNGANGITIYGYSQPKVRNNDFQNTGFGINVAQNAAPWLIGNRITYNKDGIVVQANARPILRNNYIERNERDGIVAIAQSLPDLGTVSEPGGNTIRYNGQYDIHNAVKTQSIPAYGNEITNANLSGNLDFTGTLTPSRPEPIRVARSTAPGPESASPAPATLSINSALYVSSDSPPVRNLITSPPPQIPSSSPEIAPVVAESRRRTSRLTAEAPRPSAPNPPEVAVNSNPESLNIPSSSTVIEIPVPPPESNTEARRPLLPPQRQRQSVPRAAQPVIPPMLEEAEPLPNQEMVGNDSILPVPGPNIPIGSGGYIPPVIRVAAHTPSFSAPSATDLGLQYRVIVKMDNPTEAAKVQSLVPEAFSTNLEGTMVMQAGAFRSRYNAEEVWQLLIRNGFDARIETMR